MIVINTFAWALALLQLSWVNLIGNLSLVVCVTFLKKEKWNHNPAVIKEVT